MDATAELAAVVHRLSPFAYERLLLLLHCLLCSAGTVTEGVETEARPALSLPSLCAFLLSACPGPAPRFLFALAGNDKLIRSPDGGRTWRLSFTRNIDATNTTATNADASNADDVLHEMQSLVASAAAQVDAEPDAAAAAAASSALCSAHGFEEVVALCGPPHFLAVSVDRGVTFTTSTDWLPAGLGVEAPLQHVRVLDRHHIVVSDGTRVVCVTVSEVGYGKVSIGAAAVVLSCVSQIGLLHTYSTACGGRALLVGERDVLHLSLDGGAAFLEVRHSLGQIHDVDTMDAVRRSELPALSDDLAAAALDTETSAAAASPASSHYTYLTGYRRTAPSSLTQLTALAGFERVARRDERGISYQYLLVSGCGAEVLPYDYTAVLCICTRRLPNTADVVVFSSATRVGYVPFSHARMRERLPCLIVRHPGAGGYAATRGSTVGVSTSTDLAQWTTPQGTAPVGLVALGGGDVWSCGRRAIITPVGGTASSAAAKPRTVPPALRVPYILTTFTM